MQVQAAAAGAMALAGVAAGAIELANNGSPQLLSATSAFSVFMVCSAAGAAPFLFSSFLLEEPVMTWKCNENEFLRVILLTELHVRS